MNYNIKNELIIRQKLETITDWSIEFNQNYGDKFGYDLKCFKHIKNNSETGFEKKFICYIEVEHGASWHKKELPINWPEISFLKRKVNKYDYKKNVFENECKLNGKETIYLKTNKDFTNCFFVKIDYLFRNGKESKRSKSNERLNSFLVLPRAEINVGWESFSEYIHNYSN